MLPQQNTRQLSTVILSGILLLALCNSTLCQNVDPSDFETRDIPPRLLPDFRQRLSQFIEYQRTGQWDKLPDYFVNFHLPDISRENMTYTPEQINSFLESLKEKQIFNFIYTGRSGSFSRQTPLNERVWQLWGCAQFKENGQTFWTEALILVFYLKQTFVFSTVKLGRPSMNDSTIPCQKKVGKRGR